MSHCETKFPETKLKTFAYFDAHIRMTPQTIFAEEGGWENTFYAPF